MHQPHVVWGVHVVQGAAIAVKLVRQGDAGFEIESAYVEENDGKTLPVHVASLLLARPGPKGEPAVVALPDAAEFLATVRTRASEGPRSDEELAQALQKATHFEAGHEVLRSVHVMRDGDADVFLVAAQPKSAIAAAVHEFEHKSPLPAIAFGGAAIIRGARALGLSRDPCVLVEIEPHVTVAYLVDHGHVKRRPIPIGEREILRNPADGEKLAGELRSFADARHGAGAPERPVPFVLVGPGAALAGVRLRLEHTLGDRLVSGTIGHVRVRAAQGARLHDAPIAALAGAVGAALEAFTPLDERLLVRDLPADLTPRHERSMAPWWLSAAAIALVGAVSFELWRRGQPPAPPPPPRPSASQGSEPAPEPAAQKPPAAATPAPPPQPAATVLPKVESIGPGRVRVTWPAGRGGRVLRRFDGTWSDVTTLGAAAGSTDDEVAGGSQLYGWRIDDGEAAFANVEVPVDVELVGATQREGGRFLLKRTWHGAPCTATIDVAPGEPIRATSRVGTPPVDVTLDSGCWLVAVRAKTAATQTTARVPRFRPDGTVERGADHAAVLVEREVEIEGPVVEAEGTTSSGVKRTWRKGRL